MIKGRINQEELIFINIHAPNRVLPYKKQKLTELKGQIDNSTITARDFNTPLSVMGRTTLQKNNTLYYRFINYRSRYTV